MSTLEQGAILHNMSAPPKTVVNYSGLAAFAVTRKPGSSDAAGMGDGAKGVFGTPVRFELPEDLAAKSSAGVLRYLGRSGAADPDTALAQLIDVRAKALPLPDGCVVIPTDGSYRLIWPDALSALAILAKCSDSIWLRAKRPALSAALARRQATLLVPPRYADQLPEGPS
jgi:hypothetical protein